MFYYEKCVFKASERLPFSLFIINQYCMPYVYYEKSLLKLSGKLLFNLLIHCSTLKHVFSEETESCLLVHPLF